MIPRYLTTAVLITAVLYLIHYLFQTETTIDQRYRNDPSLTCAQKAAIHALECTHTKMLATGKGYQECSECGAKLSCSCPSPKIVEEIQIPHDYLIYPANVY
jgi:hypothetical protein